MVRMAFPILQHEAMLFQANYQPYEMPRSSFVEAMRKVQNLGLILSTPQEDQLKVFTDLAQNFPSQARSLSKMAVTKEIKKEAKKNQDSFMMNMNVGVRD